MRNRWNSTSINCTLISLKSGLLKNVFIYYTTRKTSGNRSSLRHCGIYSLICSWFRWQERYCMCYKALDYHCDDHHDGRYYEYMKYMILRMVGMDISNDMTFDHTKCTQNIVVVVQIINVLSHWYNFGVIRNTRKKKLELFCMLMLVSVTRCASWFSPSRLLHLLWACSVSTLSKSRLADDLRT